MQHAFKNFEVWRAPGEHIPQDQAHSTFVWIFTLLQPCHPHHGTPGKAQFLNQLGREKIEFTDEIIPADPLTDG